MQVGGPADRPDGAEQAVVLDIKHLSPAQLGQLGVSQLAYVKPVIANGVPAFAIHAADGTPMALAPSCDVAVAAVHQHDMVAVLLH